MAGINPESVVIKLNRLLDNASDKMALFVLFNIRVPISAELQEQYPQIITDQHGYVGVLGLLNYLTGTVGGDSIYKDWGPIMAHMEAGYLEQFSLTLESKPLEAVRFTKRTRIVDGFLSD